MLQLVEDAEAMVHSLPVHTLIVLLRLAELVRWLAHARNVSAEP